MAMHRVRIQRGNDFEGGEAVATLRFRLPDDREGLVVINDAEVFGFPLDLKTCTDQQVIDRVTEYAGSRLFLIDLLNDQFLVPTSEFLESWQAGLHTVYEGELYLYGIDNEVN